MSGNGKDFERRFHRSLVRLPGASMRILDGGGVARIAQYGDFLYWDDGSDTFLFECKATNAKSLAFRRVEEQLARMDEWKGGRADLHPVVAVNFRMCGDRCVLINALDMIDYIAASDRASIPLADALDIGFECHPADGAWTLNPWEVVR